MTGGVEDEDDDEDEDVVSGAEYVASALMWPLQQAWRMELFWPPMGTAQEERVVGGWGIEVDGAQDILRC